MVERTVNFSSKDLFNTATAIPLKNIIDPKTGSGQMNIVGVHLCEREDADGTLRNVADFKLDDGRIVSTISHTVIKSAVALPDMLEENEDVIPVSVETRKGTHGRDFLVLTLI